MSTPNARWRDNVRRDWTAAAVDWGARHAEYGQMAGEVTRTVVDAARVRPGMRVLDIASGPGDSALALARAAAPGGHVTATDLVPEMLEIVRRGAARDGLENLDFQVADAEDLPFADASFDVVTCHLGVIYVADVGRTLAEVRRVLVPGGRVALTAWGPEADNPYFSAFTRPFWRFLTPPPPDPAVPSVFRFGSRGALTARLEESGFDRVVEEQREVALRWEGTPEAFLGFIRGGAPSYRRQAERLTPEQLAEVDAEIVRVIDGFRDGNRLRIPAVVVVATGMRPTR